MFEWTHFTGIEIKQCYATCTTFIKMLERFDHFGHDFEQINANVKKERKREKTNEWTNHQKNGRNQRNNHICQSCTWKRRTIELSNRAAFSQRTLSSWKKIRSILRTRYLFPLFFLIFIHFVAVCIFSHIERMNTQAHVATAMLLLSNISNKRIFYTSLMHLIYIEW